MLREGGDGAPTACFLVLLAWFCGVLPCLFVVLGVCCVCAVRVLVSGRVPRSAAAFGFTFLVSLYLGVLMTAATKTAATKRTSTSTRKATRSVPAPTGGNGNGRGVDGPVEPYVPPTLEDLAPEVVARPEPVVEAPKGHPVYGSKRLYSYRPKDGSEEIVLPHISTCSPTALFFYDNRKVDPMHQAFAWMDLCEIPTEFGRRVFMLPDAEQGELLKEWFSGLGLAPSAEVSPPGEL
jgi:hypothetical protein